jgi:hypothetical protein
LNKKGRELRVHLLYKRLKDLCEKWSALGGRAERCLIRPIKEIGLQMQGKLAFPIAYSFCQIPGLLSIDFVNLDAWSLKRVSGILNPTVT